MNIADTAIGIALIALMYLAVRRIRKRRARGGCCGCGGCSACSGCSSCAGQKLTPAHAGKRTRRLLLLRGAKA